MFNPVLCMEPLTEMLVDTEKRYLGQISPTRPTINKTLFEFLEFLGNSGCSQQYELFCRGGRGYIRARGTFFPCTKIDVLAPTTNNLERNRPARR